MNIYQLLAAKEDLFFAKLKMRFLPYFGFSLPEKWIYFGTPSWYYFSVNVKPDEPSEFVVWQWKAFSITRAATDEEQDEWYYDHCDPEPDYDPVTLSEMHETSRYMQQNLNDPMRYPL